MKGKHWGREGEEGGGVWQTFTIQPLMHIRVFLLKPFFTFLRRAAEFAVLRRAMRISLVILSSCLLVMRERRGRVSRRAYLWGQGADCSTYQSMDEIN